MDADQDLQAQRLASARQLLREHGAVFDLFDLQTPLWLEPPPVLVPGICLKALHVASCGHRFILQISISKAPDASLWEDDDYEIMRMTPDMLCFHNADQGFILAQPCFGHFNIRQQSGSTWPSSSTPRQKFPTLSAGLIGR